jgi:hypothetical protein
MATPAPKMRMNTNAEIELKELPALMRIFP